MYIDLHVKCPLFLLDLGENCIFSTDFQKLLKYQISWKSDQLDVPCEQTDGRMDSHDEAKSRFSQVCEQA